MSHLELTTWKKNQSLIEPPYRNLFPWKKIRHIWFLACEIKPLGSRKKNLSIFVQKKQANCVSVPLKKLVGIPRLGVVNSGGMQRMATGVFSTFPNDGLVRS